LANCQFTTIYWDYEIDKTVNFNCQEEPLVSGFCFFHDKDYLHDKTDYDEYKRKVLERLRYKVNHAVSNKQPLFCIGFHLTDFSLSDLSISKESTKPVYFNGSQFFGKTDFSGSKFQEVHFDNANFQGEASFHGANFQKQASFYHSDFYGKTYFSGDFNGTTNFNYVLFEGKEKVIFDIENL
jgi:hypothetical protein